MVRKYYNHTYVQRIKLFFLEEMSGPEKGRFGGYITAETKN